ncbi:MAG TPA: glycosyl hydrolase family 18 protein [Candidatus Limnocylindrales bacterium]|nr:glycosyl hydrolase family 18 protein [Candidatus Limnocylindrales bacterium]
MRVARGHVAGDGGTRLIILALIAAIAAGCATLTPTPSSNPTTDADLGPSTSVAPPTPIPIPKHEVYGFVPYWEMDATIADHIAATDLSTLGLFSVTHQRNGRIDEQTGLQRIRGPIGRAMIQAAHERKARVEIVYTSFGTTKNQRFYDDPKAQDRWIDELIGLVDELGVDGISVDVEAIPLDLVPLYGAFVGRLRTSLRERIPDAQLSVATQGNEVGAAMAAVAATAGADRIFLMGYDYRTPRTEPGASAPIDRLDGQPKDLVWSLDLYATLGVPADRLLLGLPLYGVTWPVIAPGFLAPSAGRGDAWVPRRNLRVFEDPAFAPTYDATESVEFYSVPTAFASPAASGSAGAVGDASPSPEPVAWDAVYYDSPRSLTPKLRLADDRGLAGAGFWAIGYERGLPGYTELIAAFRAGKLPRE